MHSFKVTKIIKARPIESHLNLPFVATSDFFAALPQHYFNVWHMSPHPHHKQQLYDVCVRLFFLLFVFYVMRVSITVWLGDLASKWRMCRSINMSTSAVGLLLHPFVISIPH